MAELSGTEYYLLGVIGITLVLILGTRLRPALIALLVLLSIGLSDIITLEQTLSGFSSPAVITIIGLFVIAGALEKTGVIQWISEQLARLSGHSEVNVLMVFMLAGALISLVVNNIAAGAVMLPAALRIAARSGVAPSKILLPLSYGTLLGGMATLFTTANIVLSAELQQQGLRPLTMLDFLTTGGIVALAGVAYMALVGRFLLPDHASSLHHAAHNTSVPDLRATYQLKERLWEGYVRPDSGLVGKTLSDSGIGANLGITVLALRHSDQARISFSPQERIVSNDRLLLLGREERVRMLEPSGVTIQPTSEHSQALSALATRPAEIFIPPRSPAIGKTLQALQFRTRHNLTVLAIWRSGRSYRTDVGSMPLQAGDALLVLGTATAVRALGQESSYLVPDAPPSPPEPWKGWLAMLIAALAIGASIANLVPTPEAMLAGAVALVLARCISMSDFYDLIEWRIVFLIAGMAPLSIALQEAGLADRLSQLATNTFAPLGSLGLIAGFYLLTFLVVQVLGGQVTSLIIGPLAVAAALQAGVNPPAMATAVAIACSASFLTPIAHPVNLLMVNPGGYSGMDFLRVGAGMALVCFLALLVAMPLCWQL